MDYVENSSARCTISSNSSTWSSDFCLLVIIRFRNKNLLIRTLRTPMHLFNLPKFYSPVKIYMCHFEKPSARIQLITSVCFLSLANKPW